MILQKTVDLNCIPKRIISLVPSQTELLHYFNLEEEFSLHQKIKELISKKLILSAHDISEGGLFVNLCESGFYRELGFSITTNKELRKDAFLFGEGQGRVAVSVAAQDIKEFERTMDKFPCTKLGAVTSGEIIIDEAFWGMIEGWKEKYDNAISNYLEKEEAGAALGPI